VRRTRDAEIPELQVGLGRGLLKSSSIEAHRSSWAGSKCAERTDVHARKLSLNF